MKQLEIVSFEQAKKLNKLGFDQLIQGGYYLPTKEFHQDLICFNPDDYNSSIPRVAAPTIALALSWVRQEKYIHAVIIPTITMHWTYKTMTAIVGQVEVPPYKDVAGEDYSTYEEAESAVLDAALKLLEDALQEGGA